MAEPTHHPGPEGSFPGRREWVFLAACTLVGLALRLPLLGYWGMTVGDGGAFAWLGYNLGRLDFANGLSTRWPAGYPAFMALTQLLPGLGDPETAGRVVSLVFGLGTTFIVYFLARRMFGMSVAQGAAILWTVHSRAVEFSSHVLSESTYVFWTTLAIGLVWTGVQGRSWRRALLAGLAFGIAGHVRSEGLVLAVLGSAAVVLGRRLVTVPAGRLRSAVLPAALVLAGYLAVMSPYLVYVRVETGRWQLSAKMGVGGIGADDIVPWAEAERQLSRADRPDPVAERQEPRSPSLKARAVNTLRKMHYTMSKVLPALLPLPLWLLLGMGLLSGRRTVVTTEHDPVEMWCKTAAPFLLAFAFLPMIPLCLTIIHLRIVLYALPLLLILLARGAEVLDERISETLPGRWRPLAAKCRIVLVLVSAFLGAYNLRFLVTPAGQPVGYRLAGEWLLANGAGGPSGPKVLTCPDDPYTRYYSRNPNAGGRDNWVPVLPAGELDRMATIARERGAAFVVIGEDQVPTFRPELAVLFAQGSTAPAGLREVHTAGGAPQRVKVFLVQSD